MKNINYLSIDRELYITREINILTEHLMHQWRCDFTKKKMWESMLSRINIYQNGIWKIYISSQEIKIYTNFLYKLYQEKKLCKMYQGYTWLCAKIEKNYKSYSIWNVQNIEDFLQEYKKLCKNIQSLSVPLILPRLVEIMIDSLGKWDAEEKLVIKKFSELNEQRRKLLNNILFPLLNKILDQISYLLDDQVTNLIFFLPEELEQLINNKMKNSIIQLWKERKKRSVYIFTNWTYKIITDNDEIDSIEKTIQSQNTQKNNTKEWIDQKYFWLTACPGEITGNVKIVMKESDYSKVQNWDIIVTSMTQPSIVQILDKAVWIITDEWGVLCHASIVARELQIPCITWTKYATQILKDNDIVLLNASQKYFTIWPTK